MNWIKKIGPGTLVAAAFIGPGTVTLCTLAGFNFGYDLLWALLFSVFATMVLQEMAARLGLITGQGLGESLHRYLYGGLKWFLTVFLVFGAVILGNAAYEAGNISGAILGFEVLFPDLKDISWNPGALIIGLLAFIILWIGEYKWIERLLVGLVGIMSIVFLWTAILVLPSFEVFFRGLFIPSFPARSTLTIIGLIGTTIVPYNLFLHASAVSNKWSSEEDLKTARWDTFFSVGLGGLISMAIIICAASVTYNSGFSVQSARDLAYAIKPLLGDWSPFFIATGLFAAGISSAITAPLAAVYAAAGLFSWEKDLKNWKCRLVWLIVLGMGIGFSLLGYKPIEIIFFAQIANGLLLPVIVAYLIWLMNKKELLGKWVNKTWQNLLGGLLFLIVLSLGVKSVLSAIGLL